MTAKYENMSLLEIYGQLPDIKGHNGSIVAGQLTDLTPSPRVVSGTTSNRVPPMWVGGQLDKVLVYSTAAIHMWVMCVEMGSA